MTIDLVDQFQQKLAGRAADRHRGFVDIERTAKRIPPAGHHTSVSNTREITLWCSNNHLGMAQHPAVMAAMQKSVARADSPVDGSRNDSGTSTDHTRVELEGEIADLHHKEAGLTFITGCAANDAVLGVLGNYLADPIFFSDEHNHASMIRGMRASGAERKIFRHNDTDHLEQLLAESDPGRPLVVVFESVSSTDADIAPIPEICTLARRFGALTYVDEANAVRRYGPGGSGMAAALGCADQVDLLMGTFANGYDTLGGYVTGSAAILDAVRSFAATSIFTIAMPPALATTALTGVRQLRKSDSQRRLLHQRADLMKDLFRKRRIPMVSTDSHIVPVLVGDPDKCQQLADILLYEHAQYVQPISFPSVPRGTDRLRISPSPAHSASAVRRLVEHLDKAWTEVELPRASDFVPAPVLNCKLPSARNHALGLAPDCELDSPAQRATADVRQAVSG